MTPELSEGIQILALVMVGAVAMFILSCMWAERKRTRRMSRHGFDKEGILR